MNMDFADGMRAAMKLTQQRKLVEATRVIQRALAGLRRPGAPVNQAPGVRAIEGPVIDLTAEVVESEEVVAPDDVAMPGAADSRSEPPPTPNIAAWAQDIGRLMHDARSRRASTLQSRCTDKGEVHQASRGPRGRSVPEPDLHLRGRKPKLQALHSAPAQKERTHIAGDAAWRHAGRRGLRRGNPHEHARRGAWIYRRLSEPVQSRKSIVVLELVHA